MALDAPRRLGWAHADGVGGGQDASGEPGSGREKAFWFCFSGFLRVFCWCFAFKVCVFLGVFLVYLVLLKAFLVFFFWWFYRVSSVFFLGFA